MRLTGKQYQQLTDALIDAFPSQQRLAELVKFRLEKNLNAIAMGDDLKEIIFKLIGIAESEGWIDRLIASARESNPGNPRLFAVAQEFNLATPMPSSLSGLALEKIIIKTNSFLDVNRWREALGKIEAQVCRIEITTNDGIEFGTGFLVAPNVVMTNYHVMKAVIEGKAGTNDVILRFDYKQLRDRTIINPGTEYHLADDWLIDKSSNVIGNRLPTPDELDYTLVRVEGIPGEEAIGKNAESSSALRGWVKLPTKSYEFAPNTPLLIVQHPQAEPLKLAFDTDSIIGVSENGTTVTYRTNTEPGSSGSPCFDINWNLVALHHSGDPNWLNPNYNAGTPLSAIRSRLEKQDLWVDLLSGKPI
jgi:V8-like Glu-specific endopeptidase